MSNVVFLRPRQTRKSQSKKAPRRPESTTSIMSDAEIFELQYGKENPYSRYLRRHGRRPDRGAAATIGKLMGTRVRADDRKFYPAFTADQKREHRAEREAEQKRRDRMNDIYRGASVINELALIETPTEEIIADLPPAHIEMALKGLQAAEKRFAELAAAFRILAGAQRQPLRLVDPAGSAPATSTLPASRSPD